MTGLGGQNAGTNSALAPPARMAWRENGRFRVKSMNDGRTALNLACGTKMHWAWNNLDFSPYARLRRRPWAAKMLRWTGALSDERYERLALVDPNIISWNLCRGIPFSDCTFDVVYHSHFLEHLEKQAAISFLKECCRVLKPGGVLRVVVPDLNVAVTAYVESIKALELGEADAFVIHSKATYDLFDQMVRTEITGTAKQNRLVRGLERFIRGNAARAGELHRWMYDRWSLAQLFESLHLREIHPESACTSRIVGWSSFGLDTLDDGSPAKPESLYMEAVK